MNNKEIQKNIIPRRNDIQKNTECELCIRDAMNAIEKYLPPSEKSTEAITKLTEAFNLVADIEDVIYFKQ